ncbi:STM4015 family protein [Streptosporangium carneum]|uniref:Cytoplasmic protein n=1 Tax=Streptosporangium carneum TaxID=47481 RepID=A0A9W6I044_9ACTN|nr:STM4015 family protein [Streptosporangium carneum]GLK08819.1 hypothetical protein GCM10017600_22240 [Streptosporangium carneum]
MDYAEFDASRDGAYAGLPIVQVPESDVTDPQELPAAEAAAWEIVGDYDDDGAEFEARFRRFAATVDLAKVSALVIGNWGGAYDNDPAKAIGLLTEHADRFPALRSLFFGAIEAEECEISWITQGDVTPLLAAFPLLERLDVRGGTGLLFPPVRHDNLRVLRFETGGLPASVVRGVGDSEFPALEYLELWLGTSNYGGDSSVADLESLLTGERLPALRHLGLQDSEIQDEVAAAVAAAPIVARLESLSLSMGILTDEGAEALLSGQPLTHLKRLDLHHHFLTAPMADRVRTAFADAGVKVDLSGQQKPNDDWRYVAVSE